ncbi:hypothetical protein JNM87_03900 [Candidatus Saccharibacteria bacterium]|nr:hypothetical protein [Candidatus Saccharibacteria bacterium]
MSFFSTIKYVVATGAILAAVTPSTVSATTMGSGTVSGCLDGSRADSYTTSFTRGSGTISIKDGKAICKAQEMVLESFTVPATWDGRGFNSTAIPQKMYGVTKFTVPAGQAGYSKTYSVATPEACSNTQLDFYFAPEYPAITDLHTDDARYIRGVIFKGTGSCTPAPTPTPVPTPTPTPTPEVKPVYRCDALTVTPSSTDRTKATFSVQTTLVNATLKKVVYTVKNSDGTKVVDAIERTNSETVTYTQTKEGTYKVQAVITVTANGKDDSATCSAKTLTVAAETKPAEVKPVETKNPVATPATTAPQTSAPAAKITTTTLPNTGAEGMITAFGLTTIFGTAAAYLKQRFSRR